jgi:hypothetical protein
VVTLHPQPQSGHFRTTVDLEVTLRTLRAAAGAEGRALGAETQARMLADLFRVLDRELCAGAGLPRDWRRWWLRRRSMNPHRRR